MELMSNLRLMVFMELAKEASRMLNRNAAVNLKLKVWVILVESASTQAMLYSGSW